MSNAPRLRARRRPEAAFKPSELQWLTGLPQRKVNDFDALELEHPAEPRDFNRMAVLLDRAELAGIVDSNRIAELRRHLATLRAQDRKRFPKRDEYRT